MKGEFSWLVLVAAFVTITGLCAVLTARLWRIAGSPGSPGPPAPAGDAAERNPGGSGDWPAP
jgi:hypothetical protein